MEEKVEIESEGIRKVLHSFSPEEAIVEYVWNGFDAGAKTVRISFEENGGLGALSKILVEDDGFGINHNFLKAKFKRFLSSEKISETLADQATSSTHGRNGYGRLTFFNFAQLAEWSTTFKDEQGEFKNYKITIGSEELAKYQTVGKVQSTDKKTSGTSVTFTQVFAITRDQLTGPIKEHLAKEFCWFLELFKQKGLQILIDGTPLTYEHLIQDRAETKVIYAKEGEASYSFDVSFIQWIHSLSHEYSRFYFLSSKHEETWKKATRLNNKGDDFYHSVYVTSSFFDQFTFKKTEQSDDEQGEQMALLGHTKSDAAFKFLEDELTTFLREKRRPFLEKHVAQKITEFTKAGIIPKAKDDWDIPKKIELTNLIKGLYVIQPRIFTSASDEQKKTFVLLLDALLDSDERERILKVIDEVLKLDQRDRKELFELLKETPLSNIIRLTRFIEHRLRDVAALRELVFNVSLKANERDQLQKMLDERYWIFGEQYAMVTTTEAKFDEALRKYVHLLRGVKVTRKIQHPDKNKEMDIFLCRQNVGDNTIENIVVELKSPTVTLGRKEVDQVKTYMRVILDQPEFNAANMQWAFLLVGNKFSSDEYIEGEIENAERHGEKRSGLIYSVGKYKIYAKTWSQVFVDFDIRHKTLLDQLKIDKKNLSPKFEASVDSVVQSALKKKKRG